MSYPILIILFHVAFCHIHRLRLPSNALILLQVHPFASIAQEVRNVTPRVLLNREQVGSFGYRPTDLMLLGDLITTVRQLAEMCGWKKELYELIISESDR